MSDEPEVVDELALDDQRAGADDFGALIRDAEEVVGVVVRGYPCVALVPLLVIAKTISTSTNTSMESGRGGSGEGRGGIIPLP